MANTKSAAKTAIQNQRRALRNRKIKGQVRTAIRAFREALEGGNSDLMKTTLNAATTAIRRSASKGVVKKENAARRVSRLVKAYNKSLAS